MDMAYMRGHHKDVWKFDQVAGNCPVWFSSRWPYKLRQLRTTSPTPFFKFQLLKQNHPNLVCQLHVSNIIGYFIIFQILTLVYKDYFFLSLVGYMAGWNYKLIIYERLSYLTYTYFKSQNPLNQCNLFFIKKCFSCSLLPHIC